MAEMRVVFFVEDDCLGPKGHEYINAFCKLFEQKVAEAMGESAVKVRIQTGIAGGREFSYSEAGRELAAAQIAEHLGKIMLTQQEFEQELSEMAAELEASETWRQFLSK